MSKSKSTNEVSIEQLEMVCRHVIEQEDVQLSENYRMRLITLLADTYAKQREIGTTSPDSADMFRKWSIEAIRVWDEASKEDKNPKYGKPKYGKYVRNEHGYGKNMFARRVVQAYENAGGSLTRRAMNKLVKEYWRVAVISLEEDKRLDRTNKEELPAEERWEKAGILFGPDDSKHWDSKKWKS